MLTIYALCVQDTKFHTNTGQYKNNTHFLPTIINSQKKIYIYTYIYSACACICVRKYIYIYTHTHINDSALYMYVLGRWIRKISYEILCRLIKFKTNRRVERLSLVQLLPKFVPTFLELQPNLQHEV
jgi:hypothetical protein